MDEVSRVQGPQLVGRSPGCTPSAGLGREDPLENAECESVEQLQWARPLHSSMFDGPAYTVCKWDGSFFGGMHSAHLD